MSLKIGQELEMTEDFEIEAAISGNKVTVKKGDKGFVDSRGAVHYVSGEARGKIQMIKDADIKGHDYENIAKLIYARLKSTFEIDEFLEGYDIEVQDFTEEIEDMLTDIL